MSITSIRGEERLQNLEARVEELKVEFAQATKSLEEKKEAIYLKRVQDLEKAINDVQAEIDEMIMR